MARTSKDKRTHGRRHRGEALRGGKAASTAGPSRRQRGERSEIKAGERRKHEPEVRKQTVKVERREAAPGEAARRGQGGGEMTVVLRERVEQMRKAVEAMRSEAGNAAQRREQLMQEQTRGAVNLVGEWTRLMSAWGRVGRAAMRSLTLLPRDEGDR